VISEIDFARIYAISDLHIAGSPLSIFDQHETLANLIGQVARTAKQLKAPVALVINGDAADFLADQKATGVYLDLDAWQTVERWTRTAPNDRVFLALQKALDEPNLVIVLVVGNHDIELALPSVHEPLTRFLAGDDAQKRGRFVLSLDGTGVRCRLGARTAYFVHGNDFDRFNVVDHDALRAIVAAQRAGTTPQPWYPNFGTRVVIDILNDVKQRAPFVDLFKPEAAPLFTLLGAVEPSAFAKLSKLPALLASFARGPKRLGRRVYADEDDAMPPLMSPPPTDGLGGKSALEVLAGVDEAFRRGERALDTADEAQTLGAMQWTRRAAIRAMLDGDHSFEETASDEVFERTDKHVGADVDYLVTGHTHLCRSLDRRNGRGVYFNSGTWACLMRLGRDQLDDEEKFEAFEAALERGTREALADYILRKPTVVVLDRADDAGWLTEAREDGSLGKPRLLRRSRRTT
jgi:UDP-2,3-diacylglucosamine pyrophosphatase LpxH